MKADNNKRPDLNLEPMKCELNFLSKSDGSAILSQGDTVALVSVNGPLDIKMQSQSVEKCTLEVLYSGKSGKPSVADRFKENVFRQTCEVVLLSSLYPRTGITITVQELEDFGGFLACALNCVCLSLLSSGLCMRGVFAAAAVAVDETGALVLGPPSRLRHRPTLTAAFAADRSLITCTTSGSFSAGMYNEAVEYCRAASELVFAFYREVVTRYSRVI